MDDSRDLIALYDGTMLHCHGPAVCAGRPCPVHRPSDHPLRSCPLHWRGDGGYLERVCSHGYGHPDPDDFKVRHYDYPGAHRCDGCCAGHQYRGMIPR